MSSKKLSQPSSKPSGKKDTQVPWNKGRLVGQKPHLIPEHIRAIKTRLKLEQRTRDFAMFALAIDSKLRASDLVRLMVSDIQDTEGIKSRVSIIQKKTGREVMFEITEETAKALDDWIKQVDKYSSDPLFTGLRRSKFQAISTRQYERLVKQWVASVGLDPAKYGTHSLRRSKVAELYKRTGNLRAAQLLLGHAKIESTARYLGVEIDDALSMSEKIKL